MQVREWQGSIVFLHQVVSGAADRSYGVHVARLAGLPSVVLVRAEQVLDELEAGQHGAVDAGIMMACLPLFDYHQRHEKYDENEDEITAALAALEPDSMAPREALDELYRLKALCSQKICCPARKNDTETFA